MPSRAAARLGSILATLFCLAAAAEGTAWLTQVLVLFIAGSPGVYENTQAAAYGYWVACGILLPPALVAAFGRSLCLGVRLREGGRAALLAFFFYAVVFSVLVVCFTLAYPAQSKMLLPPILGSSGPLVFCILLYLSWHTVDWVLPQPRRTLAPPPAMRVFFVLCAVLWLAALIHTWRYLEALRNTGMAYLPGLQGVWLFFPEVYLSASVPLLIFQTGLRLLRPAFTLVYLAVGVSLIMTLPSCSPLWTAFQLMRLGLAMAACVCLFSKQSGEWLVG